LDLIVVKIKYIVTSLFTVDNFRFLAER